MRDDGPNHAGVDYVIFNSVDGSLGALNVFEVMWQPGQYYSTKFSTNLYWEVWTNGNREEFGRHISRLGSRIFASSLHSNTQTPEIDSLKFCTHSEVLAQTFCLESDDELTSSLGLTDSNSCDNLNLRDAHE